MLILSTEERKAKLLIANKEFSDELLSLVKIQDKLENIYPINEQQAEDIDELYHEILTFYVQLKI